MDFEFASASSHHDHKQESVGEEVFVVPVVPVFEVGRDELAFAFNSLRGRRHAGRGFDRLAKKPQ